MSEELFWSLLALFLIMMFGGVGVMMSSSTNNNISLGASLIGLVGLMTVVIVGKEGFQNRKDNHY